MSASAFAGLPMTPELPFTRSRNRHPWLKGPGRVLAGTAVIVAFAGAFLLVGLYLLLPGDEELARRAEARLGESLGVPVTLGALHWRLLPSPALLVEDAATVQTQPIQIRRLLLRPDLVALLARRVVFKRIELDGATVPQLSLRSLAAQHKEPDPGSVWKIEPSPPARFYFRDLTWVSRRGLALVYEGEIDFDTDWRPRTADVRRPGVSPVADLHIVRQAAQTGPGLGYAQEEHDRWSTRVELGGGSIDGDLRLKTDAAGRMRLDGKLQSRGIDVAATMAAFKREQVLAGQAFGPTTLWADGDSAAELVQSLHTRSRLQISEPALLRFDLDKAVKSAGRETAGRTPLDSLSLQLDTQNTPQGIVIDYTGVKASSGAFTASGRARLSASRRIDGEFDVDLVDGLVGVPLVVSGPVESMAVSVPKSAIAGAAVGTAVLPGIGTVVGARLGAGVGKLFGSKPPAVSQPARRPAPARTKTSASAPDVSMTRTRPKVAVQPPYEGPAQ
jgi:hypothetical protein